MVEVERRAAPCIDVTDRAGERFQKPEHNHDVAIGLRDDIPPPLRRVFEEGDETAHPRGLVITRRGGGVDRTARHGYSLGVGNLIGGVSAPPPMSMTRPVTHELAGEAR